MKNQLITVEDLILAAARDCNLELMHDIVMAYRRLTGQEEGEEPEAKRARNPNLAPGDGRTLAATIEAPRTFKLRHYRASGRRRADA
jgi:hypothetical protein